MNKSVLLLKVVRAMKKIDDSELEKLTTFYCSPCSFLQKSSNKENEILDYLMYFYKSNRSYEDVGYKDRGYYENGFFVKYSNFCNIEDENIIDIMEYCVENKIDIRDCHFILSFDINYVEDFKINAIKFLEFERKYINSGSKFKFSALVRILSKDSELDLAKLEKDIRHFHTLSNKDKIDLIKKYIDQETPEIVLEGLYEEEIIKEYALSCFNEIKSVKIFNPGSCEYYSGVLFDFEIAKKMAEDKLLPLYFSFENLGRGPGCLDSLDGENLVCFINVAHGDNKCKIMLFNYLKNLKYCEHFWSSGDCD